MANEEKIFNMLELMYNKITGIEEEQHKLSQTVSRMEVENHDKFGALFDGQKALSEQVSQHTEILNNHTKILNKHTEILDKHSKTLDKHSSQLISLNDKVDAISEKVGSQEVQIKLLKK